MGRLKYRKQNDTFSCGPIAIHNALVTRGKKVPVAQIARLVGCKRFNGTKPKDFVRGARGLGLRLVKLPTWCLRSKGEFLVRCVIEYDTEFNGHYVYVKDGTVFNLIKGQVASKPRWWMVRAALTYSNSQMKSLVWGLEN